MKRLIWLLAVGALAACSSSETGGDAEACAQADEVVSQVREYRGIGMLTDEQANTATQWEFTLAEASVLATDHDLATTIRDLADASGNVAQHFDDEAAYATFEEIAGTLDSQCD